MKKIELSEKSREKLGDVMIDVAKYLFTGVLLFTFFADLADFKWALYFFSFLFAAIFLIVGLYLINK